MLYYVLLTFYILVCFLLLIVVLLQQGKGGDIAAAFGGSSSQTAFGARAGATVLTRATTILGTLFMLGALGLAVAARSASGGSVVSDRGAPAATQPAPPPLPGSTQGIPAAPAAGTAPAPATNPPAAPGKTNPPAPARKGGGGGL